MARLITSKAVSINTLMVHLLKEYHKKIGIFELMMQKQSLITTNR